MQLKRTISYIFTLFLLVMGLSFALINANPVIFDYYIGKKSISLSLLLILTLGVGVIFGFLSNFMSILKLKKERRSLKHQIKQIEKEHTPTTSLN